MKNCMKYITLIAVAMLLSTPALATKKFMPLEPADHTMINGGKFMSLGGGQDPIRLAKVKHDFLSLKQYIAPLPRRQKAAKKDEKEQPEQINQEKPTEQATGKTPLTEQFNKTDTEKLQHSWPIDENVKSIISSKYGYRTNPVTGKYSFHNGLDIAAPKGSAVIASERGKVTDTGKHKNLGNYVKLSHNDGTYSLYGHLSKITTTKGKNVRRSQKIGEVGSTGRSTGAHLHYSLHRDGKSINPIAYLKHNDKKAIALK